MHGNGLVCMCGDINIICVFAYGDGIYACVGACGYLVEEGGGGGWRGVNVGAHACMVAGVGPNVGIICGCGLLVHVVCVLVGCWSVRWVCTWVVDICGARCYSLWYVDMHEYRMLVFECVFGLLLYVVVCACGLLVLRSPSKQLAYLKLATTT
jgi:hypothetical protein